MKRNLKANANGSTSGSRAGESTRGATPERVLGDGTRPETTNHANSPAAPSGVHRATRSRSRPPAAAPAATRAPATQSTRQESEELGDELELTGFGTAVRSTVTTTLFKSTLRDSGIRSNGTPAHSTGTPALPATFPATGTSANIATAFARALPQPQPPRTNINQRRTNDQQRPVDTPQEEDSESGKETQRTGKEGVSKKRKSPSKDPAMKQQGAISDSSDEVLIEGTARGKGKRRESSTVGDIIHAAATEPRPSPSSQARRAQAQGSRAFRPDPTLMANDASSSDSDEGTQRRRRSSSKGRSVDRRAGAIPIGLRDNAVWSGGKKRKGRKGRRSATTAEIEGDDSIDQTPLDVDESQDLGGMDAPYFDHDPIQHDAEPSIDETPLDDSSDVVPATYFLRPKSPPPQDTPRAPGALPRAGPSAARNREISADPAFAAFDNDLSLSFNQSNGKSFDRSESVDMGSNYDYSEEERIVAECERRKLLLGSDSATIEPDTLRRRLAIGPPHLGARVEKMAEIVEEVFAEIDESFGDRAGRAVRRVWETLGLVWRRVMALDRAQVANALRWIAGAATLLFLLSAIVASLSSKGSQSRFDFFPFRKSSPHYSTPSLPPESLSELIDRFSTLENAMGRLSTLSDSDRQKADSNRQLVKKVTEKVLELGTALDQQSSRAENSVQRIEAMGAKEVKEFEGVIKNVKADLESLVTRVRNLNDDRLSDTDDIRKLERGIAAASEEISSLGSKVAQVAKDVQIGVKTDRIAKIALDAIEKHLPSRMAVKLDPKSGKLDVDPKFWNHLKLAFVDKKELDHAVDRKLSTALAKHSPSGSPPTVVVPTWSDFLSANEVSLKSWINSDIDGRVGSDAIVSRRTFLDMLRREIKALKVDFETKANENVQQIGEELLRKVAAQEKMNRDAQPATQPILVPAKPVLVDSSGQNITELIGTLVDSALLRYSKDILARPDYALYTSGGRVIPHLTSRTYEAQPIGTLSKFFGFLPGTARMTGRPPATALHPDNSLGSCWPFAGSNGQLGILLSRRVVPSEITLEHASIDVALDGDAQSAPKEFELWGVVEAEEEIVRLEEYRQEQTRSRESDPSSSLESEVESTASLPPTPNHILLVAGTYDITSISPLQTFPVTETARHLAIPISIVVLKLLSNHGHSHYTCIYRVRVGGAVEHIS